jgi:uncharacterized protein YdeI (BOF family)
MLLTQPLSVRTSAAREKQMLTSGRVVSAALLALFSAAGTAAAQDPRVLGDNDLISLSGKVLLVQNHSFTVQYPGGQIRVDVDEWDWRTHRLSPGEQVIVRGIVDDGLFKNKSIEARSVRVPGRNVVYYADTDDTDDIFDFESGALRAEEDTFAALDGVVRRISGREFTLRAGGRAILVDTDQMLYDPLDNVGHQQINIGDRVRVVGRIDHDLFERDEIKALSILSFLPIPSREFGPSVKASPDESGRAK